MKSFNEVRYCLTFGDSATRHNQPMHSSELSEEHFRIATMNGKNLKLKSALIETFHYLKTGAYFTQG